MLLEGLHIPLTTPFHPDGRINPHKLAGNVIRYSRSPASGLIALAPHAGEPTLLSDEETREILHTIAEAATPEKVLLANISRDSVAATLALADQAATVAFDALLLTLPSILCTRQPASHARQPASEARLFLQTIADRAALPLVLVTTDDRPIPQPLIAELAQHPNILGLLDLSSAQPLPVSQLAPNTVRRDVTVTPAFAPVTGRMLRAAEAAAPPLVTLVPAASLARNPAAAATASPPPTASPTLRTRTRSVGFQVISANPDHLLRLLMQGTAAIAPAFAACAPQACYEVFAAWKDSDEGLALEKQHRILEPARRAQSLGPAGLKFGCDLNGYFGGRPRLPHLPLNAADRIGLQQLMIPTHT